MKKVLPMRFGILYYISQHKTPVADYQLMKNIAPYYDQEKQFKKKIVFEHLEALRAAGLIIEMDTTLDNADQLTSTYIISENGRKRLKYLPFSI